MTIFSVDINITSPQPYVVGNQIVFSVSTTPVVTSAYYVWFDKDGGVLASGFDVDTLTITNEDGPFERIVTVSVIHNEDAISASIKYDVEYATTISPPPTPYSPVNRPRGNLELYRWLSYMPSWSFAALNHLSKYSKLTSYSYNIITDIAAKPIIMAATNMLGAIDTIDYPQSNYIMYAARKTKQLITNMGVFENIGMYKHVSFDSYPITNCYLLPEKIIDFNYEYNSDTDFERFVIPKESCLYLTLTDNVESEVIIVGIDGNGKLVKDKQTLMPRISTKTINKYKIVIGVYSKVSFDISTLSKSDSYRTGYIDFKRITDRRGEYFEPFFTVDYIDPSIICAQKLDGSSVYKFRTDREIDKFAITENLDLLYVSENTLYSAKLYFDVYLNVNINSTFNNNTICWTNYDDVEDGENIIFEIDTSRIAEFSNYFKIKLENNDTVVWLNRDGAETTKSTNVDVSSSVDRLKISKQKLNNSPYVMSIYIDNIKEVFQCGVIDNIIQSYKIADDIYDISIYDGNIYAHSTISAAARASLNSEYEYHSKVIDDAGNIISTSASDSATLKILPIRSCYAETEAGIILNQKVAIEEIIYE